MNKKKVSFFLIIILLLTTVVAPITYSRYKKDFASTISLNIRQPKYSVVFNANNDSATGSMANELFDYGTAKELTMNSYLLENYNFTGWNTLPDGSGTSYSDGEVINNISTIDGYILNLYAQWEGIRNYSISYVGVSSDGLATSILHGEDLNINFNNPSIRIKTITMGNRTLGPTDYSFTNGILSVNDVTDNMTITVFDISSYQYAFDTNDLVDKTYTGITKLSNFYTQGTMEIVNATTTVINEVLVNIYYTPDTKSGQPMNVTLKVDGNQVGSTQSMNLLGTRDYINGVPASVTFSNINAAPGSVISISYSANAGANNVKFTITKQEVIATIQ